MLQDQSTILSGPPFTAQQVKKGEGIQVDSLALFMKLFSKCARLFRCLWGHSTAACDDCYTCWEV